MFLREGIDSQKIRDDEWFFAILEAMTTDLRPFTVVSESVMTASSVQSKRKKKKIYFE